MTRALIVIAMIAALSSTGCSWFKRKPQAQAPPAPQIPAPEAIKPVTPPRKPAAQRKPSRPPARAATPADPAPEPISPSEPEPPSVQELGRILSPDDKARFREVYERSWLAARELLASLSGRVLTADQRDSAGRIRSFLKQAQETGASDWSAAAQLARRAEVLARDLVRVIQ
jgi:type IV secretory pathway VirB10-like protein